MTDVILSEDEFNRLKDLHAKASALMKALPYINGMGGNFTMQNVRVRELKQAVDRAASVDFANVRAATPISIPATIHIDDKIDPRIIASLKPVSKPNASTQHKRTRRAKG